MVKNELMINGSIIFNIIKNNDNFILDYKIELSGNSSLQINGNVVDNKLNGLISIYRNNNHKHLDVMFKDNLLNGKYIRYYNNENNNIEKEYYYLDNKLDSLYI